MGIFLEVWHVIIRIRVWESWTNFDKNSSQRTHVELPIYSKWAQSRPFWGSIPPTAASAKKRKRRRVSETVQHPTAKPRSLEIHMNVGWGRIEPGQLADQQMFRPSHEAGHSRISCCTKALLIGHIKREKANEASQHSHFDSATYIFEKSTFLLVSYDSDTRWVGQIHGNRPIRLIITRLYSTVIGGYVHVLKLNIYEPKPLDILADRAVQVIHEPKCKALREYLASFKQWFTETLPCSISSPSSGPSCWPLNSSAAWVVCSLNHLTLRSVPPPFMTRITCCGD